ncbi:hypothetical protein AEQ63_12280 [Pseudomonas sp. RIT-PI-o]|nr:hypothetical protein AEQ63_12280 [Pseudomonas sp. RIT-PI-o]
MAYVFERRQNGFGIQSSMPTSDMAQGGDGTGSDRFGFAGEMLEADLLSPVAIRFIQTNGNQCANDIFLSAAGQ